MHLWDGLFRTRSADSPGNSPATPELFGAGPNTLRHAAGRPAANSTTTNNTADQSQQEQRWHSVNVASVNNDSRQYQQQYSRSSPDLSAAAAGSISGSAPVQIPEAKVLPYSRLLARSSSSISPSPSQNLLASNADSPGLEAVLGFASAPAPAPAPSTGAPAPAPAPASSSSSSSGQALQQGTNLIIKAQNRSKRPPPCPSPQSRSQLLSIAAASGPSSSSIAPISPRRSTASSSNASWVPKVPSSSNLAGHSSHIGYNSSGLASSVGAGFSGSPGALAGSVTSAGALASSSSGSRRQQQLLANTLQSASPSSSSEGLLASSLRQTLSPASAAAAAAVGEAVAAVAGNPYHPHHQQTMQLLLQHQQLQMQQLQQQQQQALRSDGSGASADAAGVLSDSLLYPGGDYYGGLAVQQSPQSPRVLTRRSSSSNRLAELGTSPGLIEASFMGLAARPKQPKHSSSSSFTAANPSSRRTTLQQLQHAEHLAARQQQQQQERMLESRAGSAAASPRGSQSGSGASLADWDNSSSGQQQRQQQQRGDDCRLRRQLDVAFTTTAAAAAGADSGAQGTGPNAGPEATVGFGRSSSASLDHMLQSSRTSDSTTPTAFTSAAVSPVGSNSCYISQNNRSALPGHRGGMRVLPGQHGSHWISRADSDESAARGLLGLPRPGMVLSPASSSHQQQGLAGVGSLRSSGSLGEIEANDPDMNLYLIQNNKSKLNNNVMFPGLSMGSQQQQQQQQGFGGFPGGSVPRSVSYGASAATPSKIGEGPTSSAAAAAVGSSDTITAATAAAWMAADSSGASSSIQAPPVTRKVSFKQAAAALAAAPGSSPTSTPATAAAAADNLLRQDSFTSVRSADYEYSTGPARSTSAAAAAGAEPRVSPRASPRASPRSAAAAARSVPAGSSPYLNRSFSRQNSGFGSAMSRSGSFAGYPTCLICLDRLTPDDFESGEALQLDCLCKGEVALRHRSCAEKWSRIKGNTICDVCKAPILNLPDVPPLPVPPGQGLGNQLGGLLGPGADTGLWGSEEPPAVADYIFDCIRVTWVVLIVCILFFELSVSRAFLTGILIGSAYVALAASWSAAQRRRRQNRLAAAAAGWMQGPGMSEQRVPLLHGQVGGIEGLPV